MTAIRIHSTLLDNSTFRRRCVRLATAALSVVPKGLPRRVNANRVPPDDLEQCTCAIRKAAAEDRVEIGSVCILWPYGQRSSRTYITALDRKNRPAYFSKVSSSLSDRVRFEHEHAILRGLTEHKLFG